MPKSPAPRLHIPRRRFGRRGTPWLIVLCLLLKSGVPMLAAAAAQLRGMGVADVCPVYGVATLPASPHSASAGAGAMASMAAMGADRGRHAEAGLPADDGRHPHGGHDHHGNLAASHDHCVLTPLLGAAAFAADPAATVGAALGCEPPCAPTAADAPVHDETLAWYARGAHPPPV